MARGKTTKDLGTLQMALVGYEFEKQRIEGKIGEIQAMLKGKAASSAAAATPKPSGKKRILSAAARKRISRAQKKRWAEARKRKAQAAKEA
jgi:hypothetical protein